ncbi:tetratricopeptide repeat protein 17 isoform X2 [Nylanderia fulva]|uniref:tetratricopeptide repeat protein 17 isoform X2 n=1 Tax=Nylanderia fulva TaxID=613905 RepID=UPI0010FB19EB|nr:tetratricopeptide repeat protein 17 isoform X2 [Nylanderia fulva]
MAENMLQHFHDITEGNVKYDHMFASPTKYPKYHNIEIKKGNEDFEADHWPKISDCDGSMLMFGDGKQYLPIYLSPENKGYATHLFVNELIDIEPWKKHPLPWHPPICQTPKSFNKKYIAHTLLDATTHQRSSDASLRPFLHNLVQTADLAEIGQRILTATKAEVAASWVLSMLASLHWRIVGKPRLALDCLQLALDDVPTEFRDVPFVSIASIYHKVGLIDDAIRITNEALEINAVEPMTNFLFSILLNIKGNQTGAIYYLKQALRVDLNLYDGKALMLLKTLTCREKFNVITSNHASCEKQGINLPKHSTNLPSVLLTKYNMQASDIFLRKRQAKNCKHIIYTSTKTEEIGTYCWNNHKIELVDVSYYNKKENMHQSLVHSLLLPNSATKLHEPHIDINRISNDNMLQPYTGGTFVKISDNQKKSYYPSKDECDELKYEDWAASLFVFHEFLRRNMTIEDEIESLDDDTPTLQPTCDKGSSEINRINEMEQFSRSLQNKTELDMAEWLMMITETQNDTLQGLGTKIALALQNHCASWTLAIAASFYWRATGDSRKALDCMWQSLENTPKDMQDILLVNLASFLNSQNYLYEALEVTQIALSIGPDFVINHYVLANLYAALGDFETAASFYKSSLKLDPNFEPAITKLRVILCFLLFEDKRSEMDEILRNIL